MPRNRVHVEDFLLGEREKGGEQTLRTGAAEEKRGRGDRDKLRNGERDRERKEETDQQRNREREIGGRQGPSFIVTVQKVLLVAAAEDIPWQNPKGVPVQTPEEASRSLSLSLSSFFPFPLCSINSPCKLCMHGVFVCPSPAMSSHLLPMSLLCKIITISVST